jgi:hypothetical protein
MPASRQRRPKAKLDRLGPERVTVGWLALVHVDPSAGLSSASHSRRKSQLVD